MAFRGYSVVCDPATPTQLCVAQAGDLELWLSCGTSTSTAFRLSGDATTAADGLLLSGPMMAGGGPFHLRVRPGDELWAVGSSVPTTVKVFIRSA